MTQPLSVELADAAATENLGRRLATILSAGDLVVLIGGLGAGKTTLTRGLGDGLRVRGPVTSPTFVISRRHPSLAEGPALVHVDAYRIGSAGEMDDLDLDVDDAVTVIEWGTGLVEHLADSRLEVCITVTEDSRVATLTGYGPRWTGINVATYI